MTLPQGFLFSLSQGFCVWYDEMGFALSLCLRRMEAFQVARRLREEYALLGRLEMEGRGREPEAELCRRQIALLKEEAELLRSDLAGARERRAAELRSDRGA